MGHFIEDALFFSKINSNRHPLEWKTFPHLVFKVIPVWLLDIIRKITEEGKRRHGSGQLGDKFYFDGMTANDWCMIIFHRFEHDIIEFGSRNFLASVFIYFQRRFYDFKNAGLFLSRNEDDR